MPNVFFYACYTFVSILCLCCTGYGQEKTVKKCSQALCHSVDERRDILQLFNSSCPSASTGLSPACLPHYYHFEESGATGKAKPWTLGREFATYSVYEAGATIHWTLCDSLQGAVPVKHFSDGHCNLFLCQRLHGKGLDACCPGSVGIDEIAKTRAHDDGRVRP